MGAATSHQVVDTVEEAVDTRTEEKKEDALVRCDIVGGLMFLRCNNKFKPLMRVAERHRASGWSYLGGIFTFVPRYTSCVADEGDDIFTITMFKETIYPKLNFDLI
jgi:hypothetical protein